MEVLGQLAAKTRAVQSGQRGYLRRFESRPYKRHKTRDVGGVEDHDDMLHIGAIAFYILA